MFAGIIGALDAWVAWNWQEIGLSRLIVEENLL